MSLYVQLKQKPTFLSGLLSNIRLFLNEIVILTSVFFVVCGLKNCTHTTC